MNNFEALGRWLCGLYYRPGGKRLLGPYAQCVENVVQRSQYLVALMLGSLVSRQVLGDRVLGLPLASIDGRESFVRVAEVAMYAAVGKEFCNQFVS